MAMEVDKKGRFGGGSDGDAGDSRRVQVSLSRRGCKWADDVTLKDRDQAAAVGSDAGLSVSEQARCRVGPGDLFIPCPRPLCPAVRETGGVYLPQ